MSVTLHEILHAAESRSASLVAELSGYLVLGAADRIIGGPRALGLRDVSLESDGAIHVTGGEASNDDEAERELRTLLARALAVSRAGAPAVHRAAHSTALVGVRGLIAELEAGLIPVNRAAARRALARLHREVARAKAAGVLDRDAVAEARLPIRSSSATLATETDSSYPVASEQQSDRASNSGLRGICSPGSADGIGAGGRFEVACNSSATASPRRESTSGGRTERNSSPGTSAVPTPEAHGSRQIQERSVSSLSEGPGTLHRQSVDGWEGEEEDEVTRPLLRGERSIREDAGDLTQPCALAVVVEGTVPISLPGRSRLNGAERAGTSSPEPATRRERVDVTVPIAMPSAAPSGKARPGVSDVPSVSRGDAERAVQRSIATAPAASGEDGSGATVLPALPLVNRKTARGELNGEPAQREVDARAVEESSAALQRDSVVLAPGESGPSATKESEAEREPEPNSMAVGGEPWQKGAGSSPGALEVEDVLGMVLTPSDSRSAKPERRLPSAPRVFQPRLSDVTRLVEDFATSEVRSDRELCLQLQQLAGVDATPGNLPRVERRDSVQVVPAPTLDVSEGSDSVIEEESND